MPCWTGMHPQRLHPTSVAKKKRQEIVRSDLHLHFATCCWYLICMEAPRPERGIAIGRHVLSFKLQRLNQILHIDSKRRNWVTRKWMICPYSNPLVCGLETTLKNPGFVTWPGQEYVLIESVVMKLLALWGALDCPIAE